MSLALLGWVFTLGALLHNAEEARWLPAWSARAGRWHAPVDARSFRIAAALLSGLFVLLTMAAALSTAGGLAAYLMAGCVLAMMANAIVPHVLVSAITRRYMPGTATGVLLNLPLGALYLRQALQQHAIAWQHFRWAGPLVVLAMLAMLALLPMLFALARRFHRVAA